MKNSIRFPFLFISIMAIASCEKKPSSATEAVVTLGSAMQKSKANAEQLEKQGAATEEGYRAKLADQAVMHEKGLALEKKRHAQEVALLKAKIKRLETRLAVTDATASLKALTTPPIPSDWRSPEECRQLDAKLNQFTGQLVTLEKENKRNEQMAIEIHKETISLELQNDLAREVMAEKDPTIKTKR